MAVQKYHATGRFGFRISEIMDDTRGACRLFVTDAAFPPHGSALNAGDTPQPSLATGDEIIGVCSSSGAPVQQENHEHGMEELISTLKAVPGGQRAVLRVSVCAHVLFCFDMW